MTHSAAKPRITPSAAPKETPATIRDVIKVQAALTTVLIEEANLMDSMQIVKVGTLQERKLKLTGLLERYMRYLTHHPEQLQNVTAEDKADLRQTGDSFNAAMRRNYDTLLVARAVNGAIVKCVTEIVTKKDNPIYNARGAVGHYENLPVSVTLNQTV